MSEWVSESRSVMSDSLLTPWTNIAHGILQVRILEWVAFPFSGGSSQPRDQTQVSGTAGGYFTSWATREALRVSKDCPKSMTEPQVWISVVLENMSFFLMWAFCFSEEIFSSVGLSGRVKQGW